jgi:ribosomal protein S27AE
MLLKSSDFKSLRFFCKIKNADLACPRCGQIARLSTQVKSNWDPRVSRFHCGGCGISLVLGIIAWAPDTGPAMPPKDTVPNLLESHALRGHLVRAQRVKPMEAVNVIVVDAPEED